MTTMATTYEPPSATSADSQAAKDAPVGPDSTARIKSTVEKWYSDCKNSRSNTERQWYMNMAFYFGKHNVRLINSVSASNGFKLYTPKAPPWRVRLIINKVRGYTRTELAKITSNRPRFYVVPATTEDEDLTAARVSEQIFDSVYSNYNLKHTIRRAEWWNLVCGNAFIKCYWDPNKPDLNTKTKGDFCIEPVTPFHIYVPNLTEEELEAQPYVIHATTKSLDWANSSFPQYKGKFNANANGTNDILDDGFLNIIGAGAQKKEDVLVLECWVKPGNSLFPNGGLVTIVGGVVVQVQQVFPYKHGMYPFMKLDNIPSGKFYTTSNIEDLIPLQREYNRTRSQIIEAKNLMGKPKLMAPKGSVDAKQITSEPGQVIYYTPGFNPPTNLPLQPLPSYVLQEVQQLQQDMDDLSGQHEISRGQNPSQVTAATALSFLKEQDDTKLSGTIESLEIALEVLGKQILSHVVQFWTQPRMVRTMGEDGAFDAMMYKGSDLGGNLDVRVESGSALPQSKAAKQAFVMDLLKMGLIPQDKGLEMLDIGGIEKIYEDYLVDTRQAQRENQRLMQGEAVEANDFDNHQAHIDIHNKFRKGQQFEMLPDNIKQMFQDHVAAHQSALNTNLQPGGIFPQDNPDLAAMAGQQAGVPSAPEQGQSQPPMGGTPNG